MSRRAINARLAAAGRAEQLVETDLAHGAQHRRDVPVRQTAHDLEIVIAPLAAAADRLALVEPAANQLDHVVREIGERTERELLDLAALAVGVAEQVRDVGLAVVDAFDGGQIDRAFGLVHAANYLAAGPIAQAPP